MSRKRVLSCIQPTGKGEIHVGNYFGAVKHWVKLQDQLDCIYGIVDFHAMTVEYDPKKLPEFTLDMAMDLLACGIDPNKSILFAQSHVPEHTELCWILDCVASYGDLTRMTAFKAKSEEQDYVSVGLFNYPVLMAADIIIYKATIVPVGQDQDQHVELARDIVAKFNNRFGECFLAPMTGPDVRRSLSLKGAKILSLSDPSKKMSKSFGPKHYVGLMEPEEVIHQKIRSAVTDLGPGESNSFMGPGVENLFAILELTAPTSVYNELESEYRNKTLKYEKLKEAVFEHLMQELRPIRKRKQDLRNDAESVKRTLKEGAQKAGSIARQTMEEVRHLVGVGSF